MFAQSILLGIRQGLLLTSTRSPPQSSPLTPAAGFWNETDLQQRLLRYGIGWAQAHATFTCVPNGDVLEITSALLAKYVPCSLPSDSLSSRSPPSFSATSSINYRALPNTQPVGCRLIQAWTLDPSQLRFLCDLSPSCLGYSSSGFLTTDPDNTQPSPGTTLFVKSQAQ